MKHVEAIERRLLLAAQTVPPVGFFSADIQQPGLAPADFAALPTLNDSSATLVKEQLANAQALGQTLAVRVDHPLTSKGAINTFDQFPIQYVFGDFFDANRVAETRELGDQVLASRLSSSAVVGNFNLYPNAGTDPTRPASLAGSQAPRFPSDKPTDADYASARSTNGAGNDQMGGPALWPGSPDYRNPAQGNSGAPNIRSALFTLPIQRETLNELGLRGLTTAPADASAFAQSGRPDAIDGIDIPNVTRFNNFGNPALGGGPAGTGFVQNAATPSNGQLLSRGDFQAQVLHYRLRGAFSVNLFTTSAEGVGGAAGVVGYSDTQAQADVKTGWASSAVVNGIAGRGNYSLANLTNTIGDSGADSADINPRSTELSGAVWSGIYDNDGSVDENTGRRRMTILLSNLSAVQRTIDLPDNIGGFSTFKELGSDSFDAPDDYLIDPGQHRLLNFALQTSSRGMTEWVFTGDQFIGLDNNRNGVGVGGPGQTFADPGTAQFGSMKINDAPAILETDAGQTFASFLVTRSGDTSGAASAQYFTIGGTATSGIDFEPTSGEVDFAPDQTSKTIFVKVNGDTTVEPDETFFVRLVSPFNATLEYDQGVGTIKNDDSAPPPPPANGKVSIVTDPCDSSKKAVKIEGTDNNDTITVTKSGLSQGKVVVKINGSNKGTFSFSGSILVYGKNGNDNISIDSAITRTAFIFGGDGKDTASGGSGNDVIVGNAGNDNLKGNGGRDLLFGGDGVDKLDGGSSDDILIAGSTSQDNDLSKLCKLLDEWKRTDKNYSTRVGHILNGGGLNGSVKLNASNVFSSPGLVDSLTGGSGTDWFLAAVPGDSLIDKVSGEVVTDVG